MKLPPTIMTLYQLKQAIEYNKGRILSIETNKLYKPFSKALTIDIKDQEARRLRMNLINYRSCLKTCEFTLQRKSDELRLQKDIKKLNKEIIGRWENLCALPFNEDYFQRLVKMSRDFIQNYNEL